MGKKYEEEFEKSVARNRMSFIATLTVTELLESGKITKDDLINYVNKNAEEQKHPERAKDLVDFIETTNPRDFLAQFGWRIFDLRTFYDERRKFKKELKEKRTKEIEEKLRLAKEEKAAKKSRNKITSYQNPVRPLTPTPKRRIVVVKKKV